MYNGTIGMADALHTARIRTHHAPIRWSDRRRRSRR